MSGTDRSPSWCDSSTVILGCGNVLFGDDAFGPEVATYLNEKYNIPENAVVLDAGTGVRKVLFDLVLDHSKVSTVVIVDAVDYGREPGEIFFLSLDSLPEVKRDDFSMHQIPTSNLLKELQEFCSVSVHILACQAKEFPDIIRTGLSPAVAEAVPKAAELIYRRFLDPGRFSSPSIAPSGSPPGSSS